MRRRPKSSDGANDDQGGTRTRLPTERRGKLPRRFVLCATPVIQRIAVLKPEGQAFDVIVEREQGLKRGLSSAQMSMIAIGGAIGTGLVLGSAFAIGFAGPGVLASFVLGGAIALLMMRALAEMTVAHPTTGSFGAYAEHYLGPLAGFVVRYAYGSAYVLAIGTEVTAIAVYMKYWCAQVPGVWWIVAFSALLIAINAASVRAYGAIEYAFSSLKIAAIVAFVVLGSWFVWRAPAGSG